MLSILADNDVTLVCNVLLEILQSEAWRALWNELNVRLETFESLELPRNSSDHVIWTECQSHRIVLITGNRNAEGSDSLEATIRREGTEASLPVLTIANPI